MKILINAHHTPTLYRFRKELMQDMIRNGAKVFVTAPEKEFKKEIEELGVEFNQVHLDRTSLNLFKDIRYFFNLIKVTKRVQPDLVFSYAIKPIIYGSIAAWLSKVKKISSLISGLGFSFTENEASFLKKMITRFFGKALGKNDFIFFQNPDDLDLLIEKKVIKKEGNYLIINGSGVNLEEFSYKKQNTENISFILVARLLWHKGIREFIQAAGILKKKYPDVKFKLLGPFDKNPAAIKPEEISSWEEEGFINYLGETTDVRPFLEASSVFVLPSYREGTPRSVLEAMAMGKPVITTDAPGCRETVLEGENGFLVPVKDHCKLKEVMEKFIVYPEKIDIMGSKSRKIAEEKYDVRKVNKEILGFLNIIKAK